MLSMRKEWFNFVAVTRKKMARKIKKDVSHRDAMKEAALFWPKEKIRILNKRRREERKKTKAKLEEQSTNSTGIPKVVDKQS